jgi:AbrB family looped-hinge helix DNA binding protein
MIDESIIDEKGRVCIPLELRKRLKMTSGEKVKFQVDDGKLIIIKTTTPEQFSEAVTNFKARVKKTTDKPMTFEKLF